MSEQIFRSPGFFEREVDLTQRSARLEGIPAGVIGTSQYGPAFVPVTLGSYVDFERKFGSINKDQYGPFAVREWLNNRSAVTFIRVLGAGNGMITSDGTVENADIKHTIAGFSTVLEGDKDNNNPKFINLTAVSTVGGTALQFKKQSGGTITSLSLAGYTKNIDMKDGGDLSNVQIDGQDASISAAYDAMASVDISEWTWKNAEL